MIANMGAWLASARGVVAARLAEPAGGARWAAPGHPNGGYVLNLDGEHVIGQLVVWPDGSYEVELLDADSGGHLLQDQAQGAAEASLWSALERALAAFLAAEAGPTSGST